MLPVFITTQLTRHLFYRTTPWWPTSFPFLWITKGESSAYNEERTLVFQPHACLIDSVNQKVSLSLWWSCCDDTTIRVMPPPSVMFLRMTMVVLMTVMMMMLMMNYAQHCGNNDGSDIRAHCWITLRQIPPLKQVKEYCWQASWQPIFLFAF